MIRLKIILLFLLPVSITFSQGLNQKSIVITNNDNAKYVDVPGVAIKIIPPSGFVMSDSFFGFTHPLANSSIVITDFNAPVNKSFISFGKKELLKTGIIVDSEIMYRINGYEAMLVKGKQSAHGHIYKRLLLVIGTQTKTVLLNASFFSDSAEKHAKEIEESLLSVIFNPNEKVNPADRFEFSLNVDGTGLKQGNMMLTSMVYTDDGNVPSLSDNPTSMMVRRTKNLLPLSEEDRRTLAQKLFELYPIEWQKKDGLEPRKIKINGLSGYEMHAIGTNKQALKPEMIYQAVVFDTEYYYVITGITGGDFNKNLKMFKTVAKTLQISK